MEIDWQVVYMLFVLLAMFALAAMSLHAWQFRRVAAARGLHAFSATGFGWALCIGMMAAVAPDSALFWLQVKYLFIGLTPVGALFFVLAYTGHSRWLTWPWIAMFCVVPLLAQVILWNPQLQPLMLQHVLFAREGALTFTAELVFGPFYWVFTGYSYLLILSSMVLVLVSLWRSGELLRRQGGFIVLGLLMPLVSNFLLITGIIARQYDPLPVGLALSALMFLLAMFRHGLFRVLPVVRSRTLDAVADGILVLDTHGRVLDSNRALREITALQQGNLSGRVVSDCFAQAPALLAILPQVLQTADTAGNHLQCRLGERDFELSCTALNDDAGHPIGHTVVLRDISRRLALEASLRQGHSELEEAYRALDEVSSTDALTGLRNRRFVMQQIERDLQRCRERHEARLGFAGKRAPAASDLIVFLLDLDHFKRVNDDYGHVAGDAVLRQVRGRLQQVFREDDYQVRWGGEEFLVVARQVDRVQARHLAERLCQAFSRNTFVLPGGGPLRQSCSVGFACYPFLPHAPDVLSWLQVIDLADQALYLSKQAGRNTWRGLEAPEQADQALMSAALEEGAQSALQQGLLCLQAPTVPEEHAVLDNDLLAGLSAKVTISKF